MPRRADYPYSIGNGWAAPIASNPVVLLTVQDTNGPKMVARFPQSFVSDFHGGFVTPSNYLSGTTITVRVRWRTPATTGNVAWWFYYRIIASNTSAAGTSSSLNQVVTVSGSEGTIRETTFTIPSASLAADRYIAFILRRQTTSDTVANYVEVLDMWFEVSTSFNTSTLYVYVPTFACRLPSASTAVYALSWISDTPITQVPSFWLPKSNVSNPTFDFTLEVPEQYTGLAAPTFNLWIRTDNSISSTSFQFRLDAKAISAGEDSDPVLTQGSTATLSSPAGAKIYSVGMTLPITPPAGSLIHVRCNRLSLTDGLGTSGAFMGGMMAFQIARRNPAVVSLDPMSGAEPLTNALVINAQNDTNLTKGIASCTIGADKSLTYVTQASSLYGSGGQLEVWWRSTSANGVISFRADLASPSVGDSGDPALTTGTPVESTTSGAGKLNVAIMDVPSGIVAGDQLLIKLNVLGASSTLNADVQILKVKFKHSLAPV